MTIDEALAICDNLASEYPDLKKVMHRIKQLRNERDSLHSTARSALSDAAWERSDMKKWADKQSRDPDSD